MSSALVPSPQPETPTMADVESAATKGWWIGRASTKDLPFEVATGPTLKDRCVRDVRNLIGEFPHAVVQDEAPKATELEALLNEWNAEVREHGIWTSGHSIAARMAAALGASRPSPAPKDS